MPASNPVAVSLPELFHRNLAQFADQPAIYFAGQTLTFAEFDQASRSVAGALAWPASTCTSTARVAVMPTASSDQRPGQKSTATTATRHPGRKPTNLTRPWLLHPMA